MLEDSIMHKSGFLGRPGSSSWWSALGLPFFNAGFCIFPALRWQNDTCSVVSSYEMPTTTLADPALEIHS